jgi:TetR/AcrR family transcriptional repressor of nem operon
MSRDTREKLLDVAEKLINDRGFAATSIDQVLEGVGVTKGAFFHHFRSKADLAHALIERFAARDRKILHGNLQRAEKLSDDPLQQVLIFVGLMVELAEQIDASAHPGCLFATYCYESGLFDEHTHRVIADALLGWRVALAERLRTASVRYPLRRQVDLDSLADGLTVAFEGAFVLARALGGGSAVADQVRHYRDYLRLLFGVDENAEA